MTSQTRGTQRIHSLTSVFKPLVCILLVLDCAVSHNHNTYHLQTSAINMKLRASSKEPPGDNFVTVTVTACCCASGARFQTLVWKIISMTNKRQPCNTPLAAELVLAKRSVVKQRGSYEYTSVGAWVHPLFKGDLCVSRCCCGGRGVAWGGKAGGTTFGSGIHVEQGSDLVCEWLTYGRCVEDRSG